jgi:hypothetical protein
MYSLIFFKEGVRQQVLKQLAPLDHPLCPPCQFSFGMCADPLLSRFNLGSLASQQGHHLADATMRSRVDAVPEAVLKNLSHCQATVEHDEEVREGTMEMDCSHIVTRWTREDECSVVALLDTTKLKLLPCSVIFMTGTDTEHGHKPMERDTYMWSIRSV